jgi:acyl carrier protein
MTDVTVKEKLTRCFRTMFPSLPEASIPRANTNTVSAWDSLAAIMLLRLVEEEFDTEVDLAKLGDLNSFESLAEYLTIKSAQGVL